MTEVQHWANTAQTDHMTQRLMLLIQKFSFIAWQIVLCHHGSTHTPLAFESIPLQKWNTPLCRQVHYTAVAVGHQTVFSCLVVNVNRII